jgi:hypothetical protein
MSLIGGRKCPPRTPKCDSQRSWACKAIYSKSDLLVCTCKKGAQSGCWHNPHLLGDDELACANKVNAASQVESPMLGKSLARLPFAKELLFRRILVRKYLL